MLTLSRLIRSVRSVGNYLRNKDESSACRLLKDNIGKAVSRVPFNPTVEFDKSELLPGCGVFRWMSAEGLLTGLVGLRHTPDLDALKRLLAFCHKGGKMVYLPMYAGLPASEEVGLYSAIGYGTLTPVDYLLTRPHINVIDGDFLPIGRFYPMTVQKEFDFVIVTWAGSIKEKRWDLVPALVEKLCEKYRMLIIAYKGDINPGERNIFKSYEQRGTLQVIDELIPKDTFPRLLNKCRVMIVTSEWDNKPRIMDQALLCNIPIVVNENLYAGLKLVSEETGKAAPANKLAEFAEDVLKDLNRLSNTRKWYLDHHGPYNASIRWTQFINKIFKFSYRTICPEGYEFMYTSEYMAGIEGLPQKSQMKP